MKLLSGPSRLASALTLALAFVYPAIGHDVGNPDNPHPHYDWSVTPAAAAQQPLWFMAQANATRDSASPATVGQAPPQAAPFEAFTPRVKVRWDDHFLYVESNGLPAHNMMVGITNWQQQVPLPQQYFGANAWQLPLVPTPAAIPLSIKGRFLRGAIAIAANGVPIFNPQNNRGEVSAEIGELDQWGGHCGRADDYHYHAAPLHLQSIVGKGQPIAYALDGYPIYGLSEPDGAQPTALDAFHGHTTAALGYHYHASTKYPYVNGGFHGEVVEREGQVDPQPRANPVRPSLTPLRGAKLTGFTALPDDKSFALQYSVNGRSAAVNYAQASDGAWKFEFTNADGTTKEESYSPGGRGNRGAAPPPDGNPPPDRPQPEGRVPTAGVSVQGSPLVPSKPGSLVLKSPVVVNGGALPAEFTGDGASSTLPLEWSGAPVGTKSYALIMHHLDPEGKTKWYWTLYNIPPAVTRLDKNMRGIGTLGRNSINDRIGYAPPHSKGPGKKTYVLSLYALSAPPALNLAPAQVTGEALSAAIKDRVLASADLSVDYTREGATQIGSQGDRPPRPNNAAAQQPPPRQTGGDNAGPGGPGPGPSGPDGGPRGPGGPQGGQRKPWLQAHGAELDANKDGVITLDEILDDAKRAFAIYDRDKDGVITKDELDATGDVREGAAFAGFIFRHFSEIADADGKLTLAAMLAVAKRFFDAADLDHGGKLSTTEWQSAQNPPIGHGNPPPPPPSEAQTTPPTPGGPATSSAAQLGAPGRGRPPGGGRGGPDNKGLIKPTMADTVKVNIYADNWFVMFINGKLRVVDPIEFTPHNVVSVDILPEYPMTIAIMAKDNADPKTGMEYGDHIGDGGFIIKFSDGTVSNATWKAKNFFKGPLNRDTKNPKVEHIPIPDKWWMPDFDDSSWPNATEYTEERVGPKEHFYQFDFSGAKFIWSDDLDLDNTVIFRTKIEKPGWKPRWNTKPDIDLSGAPFK